MSQALAQAGQDIQVLIPGTTPPNISWQTLADQYGLQQEFSLNWLPVHPAMRSYDFGLRSVQWARQWDAELIYTRHPQTAATGSILGIPTIAELHDLPQGWFGPNLFRLYLRGNGAKRLVIITHALRAKLLEQYKFNADPPFCLVLPDGVDLARFDQLPDPHTARKYLVNTGKLPYLQVEQYTAGYTGHLYAGRGVDLLLTLAQSLPEISFLLVGGEPDSVAHLRQRANEFALENVHLTGFIPNAELPSYQAACDVLLMPYQRQVAGSSGGDIGQYLSPMKLFEYLACKRPIISSDLPVLREILNPQNAIMLPYDKPDAWIDSLQSLKTNSEHASQLSQHAFKTAQQHTWDIRAKKLIDFTSM